MSSESAPNFSQRMAQVLSAIVEEHVATAAPVGSKVVRERYGVAASTATIRNDMAALEAEGYVCQPHTSAGRVPEDKGYRAYVDELMPERRLKSEETAWARSECRSARDDREQLFRASCRVLSQLTRAPAMAMAPPDQPLFLQSIKLTPVSSSLVRLSYATDPGGANECLLDTSDPLSAEQVRGLSDLLAARFRQREVGALSLCSAAEIAAALGSPAPLDGLLDQIKTAIEGERPQRVYVDGSAYALDYPEYQALEALRPVVRALDDDAAVRRLLRPASRTGRLTVFIGRELDMMSLRRCALVARHYRAGGTAVGAVGVLGPTRLPYVTVVAAVHCIADQVSSILSED